MSDIMQKSMLMETKTKGTKKPSKRALIRDFWIKVEQIILEEYLTIKQLNLPMRNSYYHIREILSRKLKLNEINDFQYNYFLKKETYEYYVSDKWTAWEKKHKIERPQAKDVTIAYYEYNTKSLAYIDDFEFDFSRFQGFIFIEKSGLVQYLKPLTKHGWVLLAGEGFATREVRELISKKYPKKPILILHDWDKSGEDIHSVFEKGSKRTEHLELNFGNITDLGLREKDVIELNLPMEPESLKYRDKHPERTELDSLTVLYSRLGIENPTLWFVVKRMKEEGIPLSKEEWSSHIELETEIAFQLLEKITSIIRPLIHEQVSKTKEIQVIESILQDESLDDLGVDDLFIDIIKRYIANAEFIGKEEEEAKILIKTGIMEKTNFVRKKPEFHNGD
jgi:5S rRNA maturation endonuclease (ribonuclease M5)